MNREKMNQLSDLIQSMDMREVMNVVNNDERVLILNWFYPEHIAKMWGTTTEVIEPQMDDIKDMFENIVSSGGINTSEDIIDQAEYLEGWSIKI